MRRADRLFLITHALQGRRRAQTARQLAGTLGVSLRTVYRDDAGSESAREVEPLCLAFWGGKWTLGSWCRLRQDFRNFRPDRMTRCEASGETFAQTAGRDLPAYFAAMRHPPANALERA